MLEDPVAGGLRGLAGEVLPGGVARREVEAREEHSARRVLLDVLQAARPGGRVGSGLDRVEVLDQPGAERARLAGAIEQEAGSPLHPVVEHGCPDAARRVQQLHAAVVAGDERSLGGGQRDVELALGVFTVDE